MRELEFFFDYECPYCYKAYQALKELLKQHPDVRVIWRPTEAHPRPEDHPPHTDRAIEGYFLVKDLAENVMPYHDAMFRAVHEDAIDVEDRDALVTYAKDVVDPETFRQVLDAGTYRAIREAANSYAYDKNEVWYLPALRMNGKKLDARGGEGVTRDELAEFLQK